MRTAEPPGGRRPDRAAARRTRMPLADPACLRDSPRSCCALVTELYGGGLERVVRARGGSGARRSVDASRRRRAGRAACCSCTGCIPTRRARGSSARSSRCGRSSRSTAATSSCSTSTRTCRRGAPAPARQLRRLPVVGRHAAARGRGRDRRGRARDRDHRRRATGTEARRRRCSVKPGRRCPQAGAHA